MYIIQIRTQALKEIKHIPLPYKTNIIKAIDGLSKNPRPAIRFD